MSSIGDAENLEELYEHAPCGYLSFLTDGLIVKINETLLKWLGLQRFDVVSKMRFQDFLSVGEQIFFETQVSPLIQVQGVAEEINFSLINSSREKIPVLTSSKKFKNSEAQVSVTRMTLFKITDRKKFESELMLERKKAENLAKTKTDFLSMLSHEIRTPLNAVIGVSNLLESTTLSPEQEPFMEMLRNSSDNLMNLLNSILDLGKIESGQIALELKQFEIRKFVDGNALAWQGLAHKKGINVVADIDPNLPSSVIGDPVKITQILSNLIGNAVKFTQNGSVTLRAKYISSENSVIQIHFQVEDTGIGIAPQKLNLIFDEFRQAEYETSLHYGGTGLGLTISQKLANLMGTKIKVESALGKGSCFSFELTLKMGDPSIDTRGIERVANQTNALLGLSVLVADDSPDNLLLMMHLFKKWGALVQTARSGVEALEKIQSHLFDVVLMDMQMPLMNGFETVRAIRALADSTKSRVPVIAFSGSTSFGGYEIADEKFFDAVIGKPFKSSELIAKLLRYSKI